MSKIPKKKRDYIEATIFFLILLGTYLTTLYSYLLFHTIAELFSIVIAGGIFVIGWNSRKNIDNSFFLVIAISFLFVSFIDLIHTLAYSGMGIFTEYDSNLPTSLWIAARYLQAFSFLLASLVVNKKVNTNYLLMGYAIITSVLIILIFGRVFPECYIEGVGLTPFKIISEYIIDLILLATIFIMYKFRKEFDKKIIILIIGSIVATMIAELAFTFYISVYGISNLIGHIFKIISFFLLYKAIINIGLENPFNLLFRKLKQSELELKNIIRYSGAGITMLDENGTYLLVNEKAAEELGGRPEDFIGKTLFDVFPKELADEYINSNRKLIMTGETRMYERTFNLPVGTKTYYIIEKPIKDVENNYVSLLSVATDITERKKAEEKLERFVSIVSHELRTPITVLMMSIEYLNNNMGNIEPEVEEKLREGISRNVFLLNDLVEDILMLSRIDEKRLELEMKEYHSLEIVQEILFLIDPRLKEKKINIKLDINNNIILYGDIKRIDQIFRIFIDNAIKYSNDNSKIEIIALDNYEGKYNTNQRPGVLFQFIDHGIGISEKDLPNLFKRFFRSGQVSDIPGTGLGLVIAKELTKLHKGEIFVESELGKGSTFSVFLPRLKIS